MYRDLHNSMKVARAISSISGAADNTAIVSEIIDRAGYEALEFLINIGSLPDADATFTVLVEDGEDSGLSDAAAVADADLLGTEAQAGFTFADDNEVRKIGYKGGKRYVRLTITPASNTGAWPIGVLALLGGARRSPSQDGAGAAVTQVP